MATEPIKNIKSKVLSHFWGKLERIDYDFRFKNNTWKRLSREVYGKSDGVAVLLYNPETKSVILSKQFRMPAYIADPRSGFSIEVCGGAIDPDESPETAVKREAREEIGYQVSNLKSVGTVFLSPGIVKERVHLFVCSYKNSDRIDTGGGVDAEDEEIEVLEMPFKQAVEMIPTGEINDARTIMLLQYAQIHKLLE
ncbi:NUDIX domain-containing protein [Snuella sedimenti]|uniref:GDP-mannose pyrophosphatase n=1 Tax=Snuella sedimenti TaxID=2798802 RepID=A0A8J7J2X3_9FLAO|nr:NUDIX domain-containing protein [Snuella sedimenti]MBJ6368737.1 NUDIX domain-containing protein [Snuella sedimenti]